MINFFCTNHRLWFHIHNNTCFLWQVYSETFDTSSHALEGVGKVYHGRAAPSVPASNLAPDELSAETPKGKLPTTNYLRVCLELLQSASGVGGGGGGGGGSGHDKLHAALESIPMIMKRAGGFSSSSTWAGAVQWSWLRCFLPVLHHAEYCTAPYLIQKK